VGALTAVVLRQLDPVAFDFVDGADVNAVGADYFHVLFDFGHWTSLFVETHNAPASVPFDALYCPKPIGDGRSYGVSATIAGFAGRAPSG
jgi:hypothetical protein